MYANTYWNVAGTHFVRFKVTLERHSVTADDKITVQDSTFGFDDLNVSIDGVSSATSGLTYEDFTVTSLNTDVVTYSNGVFTAVTGGKARISIEYKGCVTYANVNVLSDVYTIPFSMYRAAETNGTFTDNGDGSATLVKNAGGGVYSLYFTVATWTELKGLAAAGGYTKIVITVSEKSDTLTLSTADIYGDKVLQQNGSGDYPIRHENDFATYAGESEIVVIVASSGSGNLTFKITLEK